VVTVVNTNEWADPSIARAQRELVDQQIDRAPQEWPPHFRAIADAIRETQCPGDLLEIGSGVGHGREILDRAGIAYRRYEGVDLSPEAVALAKQRYPESEWVVGNVGPDRLKPMGWDTVIDGSAVLHVEEWQIHLARLCEASRRWVILHRIPAAKSNPSTSLSSTKGYGHTFDAWVFKRSDVVEEMQRRGFEFVSEHPADGDSVTMTFARPRIWVTYADGRYLQRLKALYASMKRHCGPFRLHVLAWDDEAFLWANDSVDGVASCLHSDHFLADYPEMNRSALPGKPRSRAEHMWTVGPAWVAHVMRETGQPVMYIDADCFLHSSPEPVFAEIGSAPAAVFPHNFARYAQRLPGPTVESHHIFGAFNVGLVFVADRRFAEDWAEMCRQWCYDYVQEIAPPPDRKFRYGDQKYLEVLAEKYGAHVVQHPGGCAGPWGIHTRALDVRDGVIHFGGRPLVAYHYSQFQLVEGGGMVASRPEYLVSLRQEAILYAPYAVALEGR
jgi:hypothetical protein